MLDEIVYANSVLTEKTQYGIDQSYSLVLMQFIQQFQLRRNIGSLNILFRWFQSEMALFFDFETMFVLKLS